MHKVCPDIRDPKRWIGIEPNEMFAIYIRQWDQRIELAFPADRPHAYAVPRPTDTLAIQS